MASPMIKLPDGSYVNPAHVTLIELKSQPYATPPGTYTAVWVICDSGYHTRAITFFGDIRTKLADVLNGEK